MYNLENNEANEKMGISLFFVLLLLLYEYLAYLKQIEGATTEVIQKETILLFLFYLIAINAYLYLYKIDYDKTASLVIDIILFGASIYSLIAVRKIIDAKNIKIIKLKTAK